jgi:hypothetical protein
MVHRLLTAIIEGPQSVDSFYTNQQQVHNIAEHCNEKKASSKKAQEQSDKVLLLVLLLLLLLLLQRRLTPLPSPISFFSPPSVVSLMRRSSSAFTSRISRPASLPRPS